ncbi:MAG: M23 family metallopeptidase [Deltaproteobacteria bacterium]|nr:M23 family metallopeptidase [Deltaproteobacteria bacterium]
MPKDFYTLLILPKKSSSAKKICLSGALIKGVSIFLTVVLISLMYFSYDYIHIRREQRQLAQLKQQTVEQKKQIEGLMGRVNQFAAKMEELKQFDKKIRVMANMDKSRDKEQWLGIGGPVSAENRLNAQLAADDKALIAGVGKQVDRLLAEADSREQSFTDLLVFLKKKQSIMAVTPSVWPVMGWVTSEFGWRLDPFSSEREFHKGLDISTKLGRPIVAPADGIVAEVSYQSDVGQMIRIDHGRGISTLYAHLSKATVKPGTALKRGDRIGNVGNTGRSTGAHLHYAVILNGVLVNPRKYLN